jgi:hypothetical protein
MEYWIVYAFVIFIWVVSHLLNVKKVESILFVISYIVILFVVGFRKDSNDYQSYATIYYSVLSGGEFDFYRYSVGDGGIENGFALLIKLFGNLSLGFEAFIFFIAFLSITIKFYCFRKMSNDAILSILVYLSFVLFWKDLGQLRNGLSASLILLAALYWSRSNSVKYFGSVLVASSIHTVGLFGLSLTFLDKFRSKTFLFGLVIMSFIVAVYGGLITEPLKYLFYELNINDPRIIGYLQTKHSLGSTAFSFTLLNFLALSLFFIAVFDKMKSVNGYVSILVPMFVFGACIRFIAVDYSILGTRVSDLLCATSLTILVPSALSIFKKDIYKLLLMFVVAIYLSFWFYLSSNVAASYKSLLML